MFPSYITLSGTPESVFGAEKVDWWTDLHSLILYSLRVKEDESSRYISKTNNSLQFTCHFSFDII